MKSARYSIPLVCVICAACSNDNNKNNANNGNPPGGSQTAVTRTDLVSDQPGAKMTDPELVNAWGLAFNPLGAAWVNAAENGVSAVYDAQGNHVLPTVRIPAPSGAQGNSSPTGTVFNGDSGSFMGDSFIFVTEDGTISGWQQSNGQNAVMRVDDSQGMAVYKGVTLARDTAGQPRLFAADFHGGKIDVFDAAYAPVTGVDFVDPGIPGGFAPFNVRATPDSSQLVVTYAKQDAQKMDDEKGAGNGYVDLFDTQGTFKGRLVSQGELNSPWGIVFTPSSFAPAPDRMLVGNFGDGKIHAYRFSGNASTSALSTSRADASTSSRADASTSSRPDASAPAGASAPLIGALKDAKTGSDLVIDGLWSLELGVDAGGFSSKKLYFTAGPDDETHGVFGLLEAQGASQSSRGATSPDGGTATGSQGSGGSTNGYTP